MQRTKQCALVHLNSDFGVVLSHSPKVRFQITDIPCSLWKLFSNPEAVSALHKRDTSGLLQHNQSKSMGTIFVLQKVSGHDTTNNNNNNWMKRMCLEYSEKKTLISLLLYLLGWPELPPEVLHGTIPRQKAVQPGIKAYWSLGDRRQWYIYLCICEALWDPQMADARDRLILVLIF